MATLEYFLTLEHSEANTMALEATLGQMERDLPNMGYRVMSRSLEQVSSSGRNRLPDWWTWRYGKKSKPMPEESYEPSAESEPEQAAVLTTKFASVSAAKHADCLNLIIDDFENWMPSGKKGFTKADVDFIADEKAKAS
jgi:hypothetical protein